MELITVLQPAHMADHLAGYPHCTRDAAYRFHAIVCLWLVNGLWFVGPLVTTWWAWTELRALTGLDTTLDTGLDGAPTNKKGA